MRVLVVTDVHRPLDARIWSRQVSSLLDAGASVTYVAPWRATGTEPPTHPCLTTVDVPRATGRQRLRALAAVHVRLKRLAGAHDVVVVHDLEVLIAVATSRLDVPVVWDVHEDTAASLADRSWAPRPLRRMLAWAVRAFEARAERSHHLVLAEFAYQARFTQQHPVIRNLPRSIASVATPPGRDRVVYVGRLSRSRGLPQMIELGRRFASDDVRVELVGDVDADVRGLVEEAHRLGWVRWHGFLPNADALRLLEGAGVGLALLEDTPNYRSSLPSKVAEYLAHGVPVVTTPLPEAVRLVESSGGGVVVPFDDVDATQQAVRDLLQDDQTRERMGRSGLSYAREKLSWTSESERFVQLVRAWSTAA